MQSHLALCCKATLPILCMGHVKLTTDEHQGKRPLLQAARCLMKQPNSVSHLEMWSRTADVHEKEHQRTTKFIASALRLGDLRCAVLCYACPVVL